jgi:hypothetical protein
LNKTTFFIISTIFIAAVHIFTPSSHAAARGFTLSLEENTLSLTADKVPLHDILLEIARYGVTIKIDPQINPLISARFEKKPLDEALETLLKPESYSLLWESRSNNMDDGDNFVLAEIQVFRSQRKNLMRPLVPKRRTLVTKNAEGILYVKDEIILYLPVGTDLPGLMKLVQSYSATLDFNGILPGPAKILLPPGSDVFAISADIRKKLKITISQPNFAYPLESPVNLKVGAGMLSLPQTSSSYGTASSNVSIAILDSGLAANTELDGLVLSSLDVVNPDAQITDTLGHGTQMAYIASGVIKPYGSAQDDTSNISIIPIRAFDDDGYTTDINIMNSINFALENNAKVMSLSWGSENRSPFMEKTFEYAKENGLVIVASAGNEPTGKPVYPAAYPSVIGVGALEPHGRTWDKSNYGNFVMLYAPGFANFPVGHKGEPGLYAGTSISTAHVANKIAVFLSENPQASMTEIQNFLNKNF